jgi:hypothetical protein
MKLAREFRHLLDFVALQVADDRPLKVGESR